MSHDLVVKLYDLESNELSDISAIAFDPAFGRTHNQARTLTIENVPAGHSALTSVVAADGLPNLRKGNRKLVVWEDGDVIFHGRVDHIERVGDGSKNRVTIQAADPLLTDLGYDGDDRAGRPVRALGGNFISPRFVSSVDAGPTTSGPDLIMQALTNSQGEDDESGDNPGEGPLPILIDATNFDLDVPPAIDLSVLNKPDWPILIGDFITLLVETGVTDIDMVPIDPDDPPDGADPYHMVSAVARSSIGTDRHASVHFDYWTGSRNASACRHVEDFKTINNKLYDYLGPRLDTSHWKANITPGHPDVDDTIDIDGSRDRYGTFMQIRAYDTIGDESSSRPLYIALWNAEARYRVEPRDLLYITPAPDDKALFQPPADFDAGDLIRVNVGAALGISLAETQRVYGYTRTWNRNRTARVSELITSADVQ